MLNGLDLFSGIGGISCALGKWIRTCAYCEVEPYAQAVLLSKMLSGEIESAPIWDDIKTLKAEYLPPIDIIAGGFPCQDISKSGHGKGLAGERSGLFYEVIRLLKETGAPWLFLENVPTIRTRGLKEVIEAITDLGYDCRWTRVSAAEVGAPHVRERWFLLAHSNSDLHREKVDGSFKEKGCLSTKHWKENSSSWEFSGTSSNERQDPRSGHEQTYLPRSRGCASDWWEIEPNVGRVVDGVPFRLDRIKSLGNSVVKKQVSEAFCRLAGLPTGWEEV